MITDVFECEMRYKGGMDDGDNPPLRRRVTVIEKLPAGKHGRESPMLPGVKMCFLKEYDL